ncbi:hypothetical protein J7L13_01050 [bacterium]|nr:hypothetical protein [bacterium]
MRLLKVAAIFFLPKPARAERYIELFYKSGASKNHGGNPRYTASHFVYDSHQHGKHAYSYCRGCGKDTADCIESPASRNSRVERDYRSGFNRFLVFCEIFFKNHYNRGTPSLFAFRVLGDINLICKRFYETERKQVHTHASFITFKETPTNKPL